MRRTQFTAVSMLVLVVLSGGIAAATPSQPAVAQADTTVDCTYPVTVTDATGESVTVEDEPTDVVVLAPSAAQVMWEIGAKEKVVGMPVNRFTSYLNGSESRTDVVNEQGQPVAETIVDLDPDLVLAPNIIQNETVQNLRSKGLTVFRFESADSIADLTSKTRLVGQLVGTYEQAATVSARTEATVDAIATATDGESNPTVYYPMFGGYTAGPNTFQGDVIASAGGENIAAAANISGHSVISEEVVAAEDPDWIVLSNQGTLPSSAAINSTTAVENDQIVRVNGNYFSQPGPRVIQPLTTLAGTFHPESTGSLSIDPGSVSVPSCVSDVSTETTPEDGSTGEATSTPEDGSTGEATSTDETLTVTITDANVTGPDQTTDTTAQTTTSGDGPGFGVLTALLALVAAGLLARRE